MFICYYNENFFMYFINRDLSALLVNFFSLILKVFIAIKKDQQNHF